MPNLLATSSAALVLLAGVPSEAALNGGVHARRAGMPALVDSGWCHAQPERDLRGQPHPMDNLDREAESIPPPAEAERIHHSTTYRLHLSHPAGWLRVQGREERLEGTDGFFDLMASDKGSLCATALAFAHHKLHPYGRHPRLEACRAGDRRALRILPSADASEACRGEPTACLVIELPSPVTFDGIDYGFLVMTCTRKHLEGLRSSLRFDR